MPTKRARKQSGGRLAGKVAVITGGASGMGRASALRFLDEGASVVVADMNEGTGKETLDLAAQRGAAERVAFVRANVADEDDVASAVERAVDQFGGIDCMFNNAGIGGAIGSLLELDVEDWDATSAVLVRGVFLGIKHAGRAMKKAGGGGSIVNTASVSAHLGMKYQGAYGAAKGGVVQLTRVAAIEYAEHGIRANAICPGGVLTPLLWANPALPEPLTPALVEEQLKRVQPIARAGQPRDIAHAALWLASDESSFVTGTTVIVDGGWTASARPNTELAEMTQPRKP